MRDQVHVLCSGAFIDALRQMLPFLEEVTNAQLILRQGPSVGENLNAIPALLRRRAPCDLAILFDDVAHSLVAEGVIFGDTTHQIATSSIGMAVRRGTPSPDISTIDALRNALLAASSIAYSSSGSGAYLTNDLFPRLAIADAIREKGRIVRGERVADVVARGDAEIGFQQISELISVGELVVVTSLPADAQRLTVISAAVPTHATNLAGASRLIECLLTDALRPLLNSAGLCRPGDPSKLD